MCIPQRLGQGGLHGAADRPPMNPTGVSGSSALCGWHPCRQGRRTVIGAAELGPLPDHRPAVVLTASSVWPLRSSARSRSPGVAVAAEELVTLTSTAA
jgi:hypothetical protein